MVLSNPIKENKATKELNEFYEYRKKWVKNLECEKPKIIKKTKNRKEELIFLSSVFFESINNLYSRTYTGALISEEILSLIKNLIEATTQENDLINIINSEIDEYILNQRIKEITGKTGKYIDLIKHIDIYIVPSYTPASLLRNPINSWLWMDASFNINTLTIQMEEIFEIFQYDSYNPQNITNLEHFTSLPIYINDEVNLESLEITIPQVTNIENFLEDENTAKKVFFLLSKNDKEFSNLYRDYKKFFLNDDEYETFMENFSELFYTNVIEFPPQLIEVLYRKDSINFLKTYLKSKKKNYKETANSMYENFKKYIPMEKNNYFKEIINILVFEEPLFYKVLSELDTLFIQGYYGNPYIINYKEKDKEKIKNLYSLHCKHLSRVNICIEQLEGVFEKIDISDIEKSSISALL